jgi:prepilin-type N-terminal cleavage/methylation domain-containing protein
MTFNFKNSRGFTLIELLVVIAIIGILASVVLASLNTARQKGKNAAIKANIANARTQAELYYSNNNNSYAGVCTSPQGLQKIYNSTLSLLGGNTSLITCTDSINGWLLAAQISWFCSDNTGFAGEVPNKPTGATCASGSISPAPIPAPTFTPSTLQQGPSVSPGPRQAPSSLSF